MSVSASETSQRLRAQAEECRALAATLQPGEGRDRILSMAADLDSTASYAERLETNEAGSESADGK